MGGAVLDVVRCPTERIPTAADTVTIAAEAIGDIRRGLRTGQAVTAVGVAVPGLVHGPESAVQLAPNLDWHDVEIGQMLSTATGFRSMRPTTPTREPTPSICSATTTTPNI